MAAAATITGIIYLDKRASYHTYLADHGDEPANDAASRRDSARLYGGFNAALWTATACSAASTLYLYLARPERVEPSSAEASGARVTPVFAPGYAGLGLSGGF